MRNMNIFGKGALTTLLTLIFMGFMNQGWYSPKSGEAGTQTVPFTISNPAWTVPAGVTSLTVECWGGGGAGGGSTGTGAYAGGGAGGQYSIKAVAVTPGTNHAIVVGAGGVSSTTIVGPGGDSTFDATAVVAKGGVGGAIASGTTSTGGVGSTTGGVGTTVYAGGSGGNGTAASVSGGGGGGAGSTGTGNSASGGTAGAAKSANGGAGGAGVSVTNTRNAGTTYGGGGSGAFAGTATDRTGGNGAQGYVVITYTVPPPAESAGTLAVTPQSGAYVNSPMTITENFTSTPAANSCQYTINGGSNWTAGAVSGSGPYTCTASGVTSINGTALTVQMRASNDSGATWSTVSQSLGLTVDSAGPTDGTLTATAASSSQIDLSWTVATDSGSGLAASNTYKVVRADGTTLAPASCSLGTQVYLGTGTSFNDTGRAELIDYAYRVCAYDLMGNVSAGATATAKTGSANVTLNVITAGAGSGTVYSSPGAISCASGSSTGCSDTFSNLTEVTLTAGPDWKSETSWTGGCIGTGNTCGPFILNGNTSVTATFNYKQLVMMPGPTYYATIQDAYNACADGTVLEMRDQTFTEDLVFDKTVNVTFEGGYNDVWAVVGDTTIHGIVTVGGPVAGGSVIMSNVIIL